MTKLIASNLDQNGICDTYGLQSCTKLPITNVKKNYEITCGSFNAICKENLEGGVGKF